MCFLSPLFIILPVAAEMVVACLSASGLGGHGAATGQRHYSSSIC
jgi:hypothetical protein